MGQDGASINRILFVLPSGELGPELRAVSWNGTDDSQSSAPSRAPDIDFELATLEYQDALRLFETANKRCLVEFLAKGSAITIRSLLWEFVPYNDDPEDAIPQAFYDQIEAKREKLLGKDNATDREEALRDLKRAYDVFFGSDSIARNVISLFLYSGPIYESWRSCAVVESWQSQRLPSGYKLDGNNVTPQDEPKRCSMLYSGDGYLNSPFLLRKVLKYMRHERIQRIHARLLSRARRRAVAVSGGVGAPRHPSGRGDASDGPSGAIRIRGRRHRTGHGQPA